MRGDGSLGNMYCLSKALGEALLHQRRGNVPLAIVRPSFVVSAHQDPVPGWSDNAAGLLGLNMFTLMGRCPVDPHHVLFSHVSGFIYREVFAFFCTKPVVELSSQSAHSNSVVSGQAFQADENTVLDFIPVDFVVNDTLAAAWDISTGPASFQIYHSTSSDLNPLTFKRVIKYLQDFADVSPSRKAFYK